MNEAYALVEITDEEVTVSQDIDSSTKTGNITFLIQTDKVKNLDYYVSKLNVYWNPKDTKLWGHLKSIYYYWKFNV